MIVVALPLPGQYKYDCWYQSPKSQLSITCFGDTPPPPTSAFPPRRLRPCTSSPLADSAGAADPPSQCRTHPCAVLTLKPSQRRPGLSVICRVLCQSFLPWESWLACFPSEPCFFIYIWSCYQHRPPPGVRGRDDAKMCEMFHTPPVSRI